MALIKPSEARTGLGEAVPLDLGDLRRAAERLESWAKERASAIVAEARAERERILAGAEETGYAAGHARGLEEGRAAGAEEGRNAAIEEGAARVAEVTAAWEAALVELVDARRALDEDAKRAVVELAAETARRVTKRAVELDRCETVRAQLAHLIELVMTPTRLVVATAPGDAEAAREVLPALMERFGESAGASVVEDASLAPGSIVIRTEGGRLDAEVDRQTERLVAAMLGEGEAAGGGEEGAT